MKNSKLKEKLKSQEFDKSGKKIMEENKKNKSVNERQIDRNGKHMANRAFYR